MEFLEKEVEQMIWDAPLDFLSDRGLELGGRRFRQVNLGPYGIADLVFLKVLKVSGRPYYYFEIIELKRGEIGVSAFWQGVRYMKGIQQWMYAYKPNIRYQIDCSLIGKTIDTTNSVVYVTDIFKNMFIYTFDFKYDGVKFIRHCNYD